MDQIVNLAKRRGFVFPTAEIYGGLGGFWDWGPLGVLLKNNLKREWWTTFVQRRSDIVGLDAAVITNPKVWAASGHVKHFIDVLVESKKSHRRYKLEDLLDARHKEMLFAEYKAAGALPPATAAERRQALYEKLRDYLNAAVPDPVDGTKDWTIPAVFNTMFATTIGPVQHEDNRSFLRPETAQNIFVNYEGVRTTMRMKLPFGIAQIGKVFRNEITPGNFIFRDREFEQMEIEYFVRPGDDDAMFKTWLDACADWLVSIGLDKKHLRTTPQPPEELAHYSKGTTDIEYQFPLDKGWAELVGVANRTDFDLRQHGQGARGDAESFATECDETGKVKKVPFVIEPSFGVDRLALALLLDAYETVGGGRSTTTASIKEEETVLHLHPRLAPYTAAVLPLSKKPELQRLAHEIETTLQQSWMVVYDETGSIGKRYRRQDEIGTPWCITVDFDTIEGAKRKKGTVTVRDRDTMKQEDVVIAELPKYISERLK